MCKWQLGKQRERVGGPASPDRACALPKVMVACLQANAHSLCREAQSSGAQALQQAAAIMGINNPLQLARHLQGR